MLRARVVDDMRTRMGRELPRDLLRQEREQTEETVRRLDPELAAPAVDAERR